MKEIFFICGAFFIGALAFSAVCAWNGYRDYKRWLKEQSEQPKPKDE